jgi:hypothetical protein
MWSRILPLVLLVAVVGPSALAPAQAPAMRGFVFELRLVGGERLPDASLRAASRAIRGCARHVPEQVEPLVEAYRGRVGADGHPARVRPERPAEDASAAARHACVARTLARVALPTRPPAAIRIVIQWEPDSDLDPGPLAAE